jgi:tetratricopeptide (TPR) repeat protein
VRWLPLLCLASASIPLPAETLLILPFFNLTANKSLDWVGESVADAIQEALASEGWMIADRETRDETLRRLSVRRYAPLTRGSIMELALSLDAGVVISGDFSVSPTDPNLVQIQARLTNVRQLKRGAEFTESGPLDGLSQLQIRLAWHILHDLNPDQGGSMAQFIQAHPAIRIEALDNYIRGLMATTPEQKIKLFTTAARLEPEFSQPCYQLARIYYAKDDHRSAAEWYAKVRPTAARYREAQFFLGVSLFETGDYAGARRAFQTVADAIPLGEVINNLGAAQLRSGDPVAIETFQHALEADPYDPVYLFNTGYALWKAGRFDDAANRLRAALERDPTDEVATLLLGRCLQKSGPRPGDLKTENLEVLKTQYSESAWLQLKALIRQ